MQTPFSRAVSGLRMLKSIISISTRTVPVTTRGAIPRIMHHVPFRTEEKEVAIAAESVSNAWYVNTKGDRITDHICIGHAV